MVAVCLLTCDRPALTAIAAQSFVAYNPGRRELLLLHADGGSETGENVGIARAHGFQTLVAPPRAERIGQMATLRIFLEAVQRAGAEWMVWLENDWESVAALPNERFIATSGMDTIRLFGVRKMRTGPRALAGPHRIGTREPIVWTPAMPGWEQGRAHWGGGGTIVRTDVLTRQVHQPRLKDVITADTALRSLRPLHNLMWSLGLETTPGFLG